MVYIVDETSAATVDNGGLNQMEREKANTELFVNVRYCG